MRRLLLVTLLVALAGALAAQTSTPFVTRVKPALFGAGATVDVAGFIAGTPRIAGDLCFFGVGVVYNPRLSPFVHPYVLLGMSRFRKVTINGRTGLLAKLRFQVPKGLPKGITLPLFFQAAAVVLTPRGPRVLPATPAKAVLKT